MIKINEQKPYSKEGYKGSFLTNSPKRGRVKEEQKIGNFLTNSPKRGRVKGNFNKTRI